MKRPTYCPHGNPAELIEVMVEHPRGHTLIGSVTDLCDPGTYNVRAPYRFKKWVPQCIACIESEAVIT